LKIDKEGLRNRKANLFALKVPLISFKQFNTMGATNTLPNEPAHFRNSSKLSNNMVDQTTAIVDYGDSN
jgi:hypothetical protein